MTIILNSTEVPYAVQRKLDTSLNVSPGEQHHLLSCQPSVFFFFYSRLAKNKSESSVRVTQREQFAWTLRARARVSEAKCVLRVARAGSPAVAKRSRFDWLLPLQSSLPSGAQRTDWLAEGQAASPFKDFTSSFTSSCSRGPTGIAPRLLWTMFLLQYTGTCFKFRPCSLGWQRRSGFLVRLYLCRCRFARCRWASGDEWVLSDSDVRLCAV